MVEEADHSPSKKNNPGSCSAFLKNSTALETSCQSPLNNTYIEVYTVLSDSCLGFRAPRRSVRAVSVLVLRVYYGVAEPTFLMFHEVPSIQGAVSSPSICRCSTLRIAQHFGRSESLDQKPKHGKVLQQKYIQQQSWSSLSFVPQACMLVILTTAVGAECRSVACPFLTSKALVCAEKRLPLPVPLPGI